MTRIAIILAVSAASAIAGIKYPEISQALYNRLATEYQTNGLDSVGGEASSIRHGNKIVIPLPSGAEMFTVTFTADPAFPEWNEAILTDDSSTQHKMTDDVDRSQAPQFDPMSNPLPDSRTKKGWFQIDGFKVYLVVMNDVYDTDGVPVPDECYVHWGTGSGPTTAGADTDWAHLSVPAGQGVGWQQFGHPSGGKGFGPAETANGKVTVCRASHGTSFAPFKLYYSADNSNWTLTTAYTVSNAQMPDFGKVEWNRSTLTFTGAMLTAHNAAIAAGTPIFYRTGNP